MQSFYLSCTPGFEESLAQEIRECWPWLIEINGQPQQNPLPEMILDKGGLLLQTPFAVGVQLNFFVKTAHRVLWRLAEFKVRDFPKLFEKIQKIPWAQILTSDTVEWKVAASKSRLNHEKRIEETCQEAFAKVAGRIQGGPQQAPQTVYVRLHGDLCSISLDTSGENLHKRGWGIMKGEAPLRETLAAYMVRELIGEESPGKLREVSLVDPMCGSGTLLFEAASLWQPVFSREFPFLTWKNTPKIFKSPLFAKNYKLLSAATPFHSYRGYDVNDKVLAAARENQTLLQERTQLKEIDMEFAKEDLFGGSRKTPHRPVWCLSNPPYGERLYVQGTEVFSYQDLLNRITEKFQPEKVALLLPHKSLVKNLKPAPGYRKLQEIPFTNGGLEVLFLIYGQELS